MILAVLTHHPAYAAVLLYTSIAHWVNLAITLSNGNNRLIESIIIFFAALIHGALGLGFPMTSTPLLAWQGSLMRAIQLTLIPTMGVNILMIIRQSQPWQSLRPFVWMLPAMALGTILGSLLILTLNPNIFQSLLAFVIMIFLWLDYRNHLTHTNQSKQPRGIFLAGLVAGILVGNVNAGVPALIVFALYNQLDRDQSVMLFNACFLTGKITQVMLFGSLGALNIEWQKMGLMLLLIALLGVTAGQWLGKRLDQARWRAIMRGLLLFIALSLLFKVFANDPAAV